MSTTEFQPTLPVEIAPTDAELEFMELSPFGLFPENQDSNFGLFIRKLWCDRITEIASQQTTMFNEKFPDTSMQFLDEHERQYGLPIAPSTLTLQQRRGLVLSRIRVGPFTRTRLRDTVENFITATFGGAIQLTPAGVPMDAAGVPLYADLTALTSSYHIYEYPQNSSYIIQILSSITPDIVGLTRELTRITPAHLTFTIDNSVTNVRNYAYGVRAFDPVAEWTMATLTDATGLGSNLTAAGGATIGNYASPGLLASGINGVSAGTDLDGTDDAFLINAPSARMGWLTGPQTWMAWIRPDTLPTSSNHRMIFSSQSIAEYMSIYNPSGTTNFFGSMVINGAQRTIAGATPLVAATTYFVAMTYDGINIRLYVNGVLDGTSGNFEGSVTPPGASYIGRYSSPTYYFDGKIQEVALINQALSADDLLTLNNIGRNL
jgi:Concanavalin A-like lectin/glucanases superfamily